MMRMQDAVRILEKHRKDALVISSQSARAAWMKVSKNAALDIPFAGSMSKESSFGLGLALARPERRIIVLSGDGELLMNLGTLVTIARQAPINYYHFVMQNGVYAFTGGQATPGGHKIDFSSFAGSAGYRSVHRFDAPESLSSRIEEILSEKGPVFVTLLLEPQTDGGVSAKGPFPWRPLKEYLHGIREKLGEF
ncbi:MAG: thiamine pyrophosphate-binding protein [Desulfobacteraceae bacterium]|nr:MAG: thiamine pyrophosphate-binding protein [Desulfobacteraceae bacterium]